jgi:hypothetical protein
MLILVLVLGAVVAGALPPAPATAGPMGCPVFPFPDDELDLVGARLLPQIGPFPSPAPPANWPDRVAELVYRGVLRPVLKLLLLL